MTDRAEMKLNGGMIEISFPYDPDWVIAVKHIPGRKWDNTGKVWTVPIVSGVNLMEELHIFAETTGTQVPPEITVAVVEAEESLERNIKLSSAITTDWRSDLIPEGIAQVVRPFQWAGIEYIVKNGNVLLGDDMGTGKTLQSLLAMEIKRAYPLLIICPASLKYNWYYEIQKWLNGRIAYILNSGGVADLDGQSGDEPGQIFIINYDVLDSQPWIFDMMWKGLIVDESHYIKNYKAERTKQVQEIAKMSEKVLLLSGTAVLNRPQELLTQLSTLRTLEPLGGFWGFAKKYCEARQEEIYIKGGDKKKIWKMDGAANLDELNRELRKLCYIRREKRDVLPELPEKTRTALPVEISNRARYDEAESDLINYLRENARLEKDFLESLGDLDGESRAEAIKAYREDKAQKAKRAQALVKIETCKYLSAMGKLEQAVDFARDVLLNGDKLIVFAWHQKVIELLADTFKCNAITGETPLEVRDAIVRQFQEDPENRIIVLNIQAAGVGLTLTAASKVLFVEYGWNPGTMDQAEDRAHRMGQRNPVNIYEMFGIGTIDEGIIRMIEEKRKVVTGALQGESLDDVSYLTQFLVKES